MIATKSFPNSTRTKPSITAQLISGHPLGIGMMSAWLLGEKFSTISNRTNFSLFRGSVINSPTWKSDGRLTINTASSQEVRFGINTIGPRIDKARTLLVDSIFSLTAFPTAGNIGRIFSIVIGSSSTGLLLGVFNNAGTTQLECGARSATGDGLQVAQFNYSKTNDRVHLMGFVDFTTATVKLYVNGILQVTTNATFANKFYVHTTATSNSDTIGGFTTSNSYIDGAIECVRLWKNIRFIDSMARQLFEAPYSMFK